MYLVKQVLSHKFKTLSTIRRSKLNIFGTIPFLKFIVIFCYKKSKNKQVLLIDVRDNHCIFCLICGNLSPVMETISPAVADDISCRIPGNRDNFVKTYNIFIA